MSPRRLTAGLLAVQVGFQAGLALGAPWGSAAYGGQHPGVLPARLRAVSAVATGAYAVAAVAVGTDRLAPASRRRVLTTVTCFVGVGTLPNAVSRSPVERGWAAYCVVTALSAWRARRLV